MQSRSLKSRLLLHNNLLTGSIGSLDDAILDMQEQNGLKDVRTEEIQYVMEQDILGMLGLNGSINNNSSGELGILMQLMEQSNKVTIEFICPIRK